MIKKPSVNQRVGLLEEDAVKLYQAMEACLKRLGEISVEVMVLKECLKVGNGEGPVGKAWLPVHTIDPEAPKKRNYHVVY